MDYNLMVDRIKTLSSELGISPTKAYIDCGVGKDFAYSILKQGKIPSIEKIHKLSEYFKVSTDYLIGNTDIKKEPSPELEEKARALGQYLLDKGIVPDLSDESLSVVMDILNANTDIIRKILNNEK